MRHVMTLLCLSLLVVVPATAAPTISLTPPTIDTLEVNPVRVDVTNIVGATIVLRLRVDVDGDGVADPEDYLIWSDVVDDDATEWSPNMLADEDTDPGEVTVRPRLFTPLKYPNAVGNYLWEVEDAAAASPFDRAAFSVTQTTGAQSVSGTVSDGVLPLGGALVVLLPINEDCDAREYTAFTDAAGNYSLELAAGLACEQRVVLSARPGYVGGFLGQPSLEFTGSDAFAGVDLTLSAGDWMVDGAVKYEDGPRVGQGIPGAFVFADGDDGFSVGFSDGDGGYDFMLGDGNWSIEVDEAVGLALQGAVYVEDRGVGVSVSGAPVSASDAFYPAANAFISGTLFDDGSTPLPALEVNAGRNFPCDPDCFESEIFTAGDGSFTLGVIGPDLPDSDDYELAPETPREGLVARRDTVAVSNGSNLPANIEHVTPTAWITGSFSDIQGDPLSDLCLSAYSFTGLSYESRATVGCDGSYTLPVVDGSWQVGYEGTDLLGFYRDLDTGRVDRSVVVSGGNVSGIDFILGRFLLAPAVTRVEPPAAQSGAHVLLSGHALPGQSGQILVGGSPATLVASRPDLGKIVVEVPSLSGPGSAAVVVNDTDSGLGSNESCLEIQVGTYTPDCVLSGTATDSGVSPVAGAVVAVLRQADETFERLAVTDASGDWSAGVLAVGAPYDLLFLPPQGQGFIAASYTGLACGATQDHTFLPGAEITGTVVDGNMQGIPFADVEVSDGVDTIYDTQLTDDQGAYSLRAPSASSVIVSARAPIGSRWVNQPGVAVQTNTDPTFAPQIQQDTGSLFAGRALNGVIAPLFVERDGVAARVIALPVSGLGFGLTETDQCSGNFAVAVQDGAYDLQIDPLFLPTDESTLVSTVTVDGDTLAEFDFPIFDESPLQYTGPEPRGSYDMDSRAQVGQPMLIRVENLDGTFASVNFPDGPMGLPGVDPVFDAARGLVLTKVPPGAQSGELVFAVDGTFSNGNSSFPFLLQPGVFDPGSFTLSGTITGSASPLSGALVILLTVDPGDPDCNPEGEINDYAVTDGSGSFTVSHPGGDVQLLVLPPTATTFSPAQDALNLAGDVAGYGNDLQPGQALTLRAVTGAPAVPVPNVTVDAEGSVFDLRLTAADGTATLYVPAGSYDVRLSGPYGSRLVGQQLMATAPVDLGDVAMASGLLVGGRVVDVNGDPVAGAFAEARGTAPPFDGYSEVQTDSNGVARGALPASTAYRLFVEGPTASLADVNIDGDPRFTDLIGYPSVVLAPAGAIAGSITDLVTGAAVPQIDIDVNENVGGAFGPGSGFDQSCDDGGYHVKVAVGAHFVGANTAETPEYYGSYYPSDFCSNVPGSVNAVEGLVTGSIDIELLPKTATPVCTVLGNVSTRGQVGTGADVLIGGFIVEGLTPKRVLVRALGPTLGGPPFNVPGAMTNPQLTLTTVTGTPITSNDDWRTGGQEAEITATGFAPPNDLEPAVIVDLAPGAYTPIVSGVAGGTGVGIVEVYELDGSAIARLTNVSTRGQVGTGSDQLIGGFVVQGPGNKTVLVRALGPTLAGPPFNVPGALVNPQLILTTVGGSVLASNDDWSTGSQVSEISATGLAPPDGTEPAILIDLAPGAYTPIVSGVAGGTGVGIVEIYEINP